jgi:hypothetical protein
VSPLLTMRADDLRAHVSMLKLRAVLGSTAARSASVPDFIVFDSLLARTIRKTTDPTMTTPTARKKAADPLTLCPPMVAKMCSGRAEVQHWRARRKMLGV